jgi:D-ornithine 4,5-aminomutase subunit alpha
MSLQARADDFQARRAHLQHLLDTELHEYFWRLIDQMVRPIVEEARTHTSPSIERSVLLRMGFSSLEARGLVTMMLEKDLLSQGAGHLVLQLAHTHGMTVREAGLALLAGTYWEECAACVR